MTVDLGALASDYLRATRDGGDAAAIFERSLAALDDADLHSGLDHDAKRIAFWINVYNAAVVRAGVADLETPRTRWRYFRRPAIVVAGQPLSLDAIEHGLLRRSRWKLGLGYLGNPRPGPFERRHRVDRLDARIHFALNCGAASCPPIATYEATRIAEQLDVATTSYLGTEVVAEGGVIRVPVLLLWYIGDFGGPQGLRRLLRQAGVSGWGRRLRFRAYDWTPVSGRWTDDAGGSPP